jgi:hypothetical protein
MVTSSRVAEWGVSEMVQTRNAYTVLVGKPEVKRKLEQPRCRWDDNINMDFKRKDA